MRISDWSSDVCSSDLPTVLPDGTRLFSRLRGYVGRGVVTTSTYEARALGVFSAMGMMKAALLAPEAILLPVDFKAYRHCSQLFKAAVAGIAPHIEDRSEEHTSELQSLMRISYAVFCLKKKKQQSHIKSIQNHI